MLALPHHAAEGARAIWGTADAIWTALGDRSTDINWYTKRVSLSAVYGATVLYWMGDDSEGHQATWDFLDRRIETVMSFEKTKAALRENPLAKALIALVCGGDRGVTALEAATWAYRLAAYCHELRTRYGLAIRTDREEHPGGWHGLLCRLVQRLRSPGQDPTCLRRRNPLRPLVADQG